MSKFFETSEEFVELAQQEFERVGLAQIGVNLKCISITKSNAVLNASKASALTEFRTHVGDTVHLIIFEEAFSRLSEEQQRILMEGCISNISYDTEKDKHMVDKSQYGELIRMRQKYPNYADIIEIAQAAIDQVAEEEKLRKQDEKAAKKQG